jgi:hypothetical protein
MESFFFYLKIPDLRKRTTIAVTMLVALSEGIRIQAICKKKSCQ